MDAKHKHLECIQGVINRLASDSFRIKGWNVVLVAALIILLAREGDTGLAPLVALVPVLAFWGLDGYFLRQEHLFRALYDHVRGLDESDIDYAMNVGPFRTSFSRTWLGATLSRTLIVFHSTLFVAVAVVPLLDR